MAVAIPDAVGKPAEPPDIQSRARGVPTSTAAPTPSIATGSAAADGLFATPERRTATPSLPALPPPKASPLEAEFEPDLPPCPPDRASRVDAIERMMLALNWERGKTGPRLAQAWGLTLSAIEQYSAEASRNIKRSTDQQAMKSQLAKALQDGLEQAFAQGEVKAVASLVKTYLEMLGLAGSKVQVNILQAPTVVDFIGSAVAFMEALCPEASDDIDAWVAAARDDVDGARSDPAGWLERRRGTITVEADA
ncbi:hypothetical protein [Sorangium sp. So ce388]|uniref:hypothetical protein n=1 Tax=Sorangium sp. So ce388 TaxID=3133309 RepID=UPI003F5C17A0